jgi:hypothetical protein
VEAVTPPYQGEYVPRSLAGAGGWGTHAAVVRDELAPRVASAGRRILRAVDAGFRVRQRVAQELVAEGKIDGLVAISLIVDPGPELKAWSIEASTHSTWSDAQKDQARELAARGLSQREIAVQVCGSAKYRTTVATWLRQRPAV